MITTVTGSPGSGKTLHATRMIRGAIDEGRTAYTNVHVNDDRETWYYYEDFALMTKASEGFIVLDEAQTYMNSREWQNMPPEWTAFLQQHRHEGLDLLALVQDIARVDITFRELTKDQIFEVRRSFFWEYFKFGLYRLYQISFVRDDLATSRVAGFAKWHWFGQRDYDYYDTHARRSNDYSQIVKECPMCGRKHFLVGWIDKATGKPVKFVKRSPRLILGPGRGAGG